MTARIIILKNTTGGPLKYKGIVVKHTTDRDYYKQMEQLCEHPRLGTDIDAGYIIVNDGTTDLSAEDGKIHMCQALFDTYVPPPIVTNLSSIPFETGPVGFADVAEYGETGLIKDKFINSAYNAHTSVDSTVIALADGQVVHVTLSTEENEQNSWDCQIVVGATKAGGTVNSKTPCIATTTADIMNGGSTWDDSSKKHYGTFDHVDLTDNVIFDGVPSVTAFIVGDRILVKDQTDAKQNGIYSVNQDGSDGKIERTSDFDADSDAVQDVCVPVQTGTLYADTNFCLTADAEITVDDIIFMQQPAINAAHSGGTQIGTDLQKPAGVLDKVHTNLTGFNFSAGDRISVYVKGGLDGTGEADEPVIRLFLQYD